MDHGSTMMLLACILLESKFETNGCKTRKPSLVTPITLQKLFISTGAQVNIKTETRNQPSRGRTRSEIKSGQEISWIPN